MNDVQKDAMLKRYSQLSNNKLEEVTSKSFVDRIKATVLKAQELADQVVNALTPNGKEPDFETARKALRRLRNSELSIVEHWRPFINDVAEILPALEGEVGTVSAPESVPTGPPVPVDEALLDRLRFEANGAMTLRSDLRRILDGQVASGTRYPELAGEVQSVVELRDSLSKKVDALNEQLEQLAANTVKAGGEADEKLKAAEKQLAEVTAARDELAAAVKVLPSELRIAQEKAAMYDDLAQRLKEVEHVAAEAQKQRADLEQQLHKSKKGK